MVVHSINEKSSIADTPLLQGASFINDFSSVSRSTAVTVGPDTSMQLAPANVARQYLVISNKSANSVYINLGSADATQSSGILISASSTYTIDQNALYTGAIQAVASATGTVLVTEK